MQLSISFNAFLNTMLIQSILAVPSFFLTHSLSSFRLKHTYILWMWINDVLTVDYMLFPNWPFKLICTSSVAAAQNDDGRCSCCPCILAFHKYNMKLVGHSINNNLHWRGMERPLKLNCICTMCWYRLMNTTQRQMANQKKNFISYQFPSKGYRNNRPI